MSAGNNMTYCVHFMSNAGVCVSRIAKEVDQVLDTEYLGPTGGWVKTATYCWTDSIDDLIKNLIRLEGLATIQRGDLSMSVCVPTSDVGRFEKKPEHQPVKRILDLTKE